MNRIAIVVLATALGGCAAMEPSGGSPSRSSFIDAQRVPVGQPRRLPDEAVVAADPALPNPAQDLYRVEAALEAQVPDGGHAEVLMTTVNAEGWSCGRVRFVSVGGAPVLFAARPRREPIDVILGRDADSLERIGRLCGR